MRKYTPVVGSLSHQVLTLIEELYPDKPDHKEIAARLAAPPSAVLQSAEILIRNGVIGCERDGDVDRYLAKPKVVETDYPHLRRRIVPPTEWRRSSGA